MVFGNTIMPIMEQLKAKPCPITFITFHNCCYYINIVVNNSTYTTNARPPYALILEPDTEISTNFPPKNLPSKISPNVDKICFLSFIFLDLNYVE